MHKYVVDSVVKISLMTFYLAAVFFVDTLSANDICYTRSNKLSVELFYYQIYNIQTLV